MPPKPSAAAARSSPPEGLMDLLQVRQQQVLGLMPRYFRRVVYWALFGFVLSVTLQSVMALSSSLASVWETGDWETWLSLLLQNMGASLALDHFSLGTLISFILSLFSNVIMWAFVFWSMSFIPYIAANAYKVSREIHASVATRPFKWVQLYAATFLPMAVFAIAWNSTPNRSASVLIRVNSPQDALYLVVGSLVIAALLFLIIALVPARIISIRLSLLSALFYASLYLAYGAGYSVASFATLFGILLYLMFASSQIEEMGRRIVIYDLEHEVAKGLDVIETQYQQLQISADQAALADHKRDVLEQQIKTTSKLAETRVKQELNEQLSAIQTKRVDLIKKTNQAQIEMLEQKIRMLGDVFDVVQREFSTKLKEDFPKQLEEIRDKARNLSPQELDLQMNTLMQKMNPFLEGMPETMDELRNQLIDATNEIEKQTKRLLTGEVVGPKKVKSKKP